MSETRELFKLALPIILAQLTQMSFGLVDTLMVGHLGTTELAAATFGNNVFILFFVLAIGLANATAPYVASAVGRKDFFHARHVLQNALIVNLISSSVLMILAWFCLLGFGHLGQTPEVTALGASFFAIYSLTLIPGILFHCYKQYLECIGLAFVPMFFVAFGLISNVVLNRIFIFGYGPVPAMGVPGSAVATLIARNAMLILIAGYTTKSRRVRPFRIFDKTLLPPSRVKVFRELMALGIPAAMTLLFEVGSFAIAAVIVGWTGSTPLAAYQVVMMLASFVFMVPLGLSFAASIRIAMEVAKGNLERARRSGWTAIKYSFAFMSITALSFYFGRNWLPTLFSSDPEVVTMAASFLTVGALLQFSDGVQVVACGLLRGLKDTRWPMIISFIAYWVLSIPLGYILAFHGGLGPVGIWWGHVTGLTFAAILLCLRFGFISRKLKLV